MIRGLTKKKSLMILTTIVHPKISFHLVACLQSSVTKLTTAIYFLRATEKTKPRLVEETRSWPARL